MTGRKVREEIAWLLAVLAAGLLCLALLLLYPLCLLAGKLDDLRKRR